MELNYLDECTAFLKRQANKQQKYSKNKQKRAYIQFKEPKAYKSSNKRKQDDLLLYYPVFVEQKES